MALLRCLLVVCLTAGFSTAVKVTEDTTSFSSASKGGTVLALLENEVFHTSDGPGYITQQWFTAFPAGSRVRIYIDGEKKASIDADLLMLVGVGNCSDQDAQTTPWSNRRFGQLAHNGGIYTNIRIPFRKSVSVKIVAPTDGTYWFIIRYVTGSPLIVNGYELPDNTRLRLYNIDNKLYQPYEMVEGANVENKAGWLYMVAVAAQSVDYLYLEACFRLNIDGLKEQFLSSGTEDFFLSAYYFNAGIYHSDAAGLTCYDKVGMFSAYKMFEDDPIFFKKSMTLNWRCGEKQGALGGCPNTFQPRGLGDWTPKNTTASMYVWVYEYTLS